MERFYGYIAEDIVPIYTVEKPVFIHMLKTFNTMYVLDSCNRACLKPEVVEFSDINV